MKIERFKEIEKGVVGLVESTLKAVAETSIDDYKLLLIRADFYRIIDSHPSCNLSPYVIDNPADIYLDVSRRRFLNHYLSEYVIKLEEKRFDNLESLEYEINIQMMMYTHVWESRLFLKALERIASILSGKGYKWKSDIGISKANFIKDHIINPLNKGQYSIGKYLEHLYDNELRNCFSHSTHYIDCQNKKIHIDDKKSVLWKKTITFNEWEEMFICSVLLSYHLMSCLNKHRLCLANEMRITPQLLERPLKSCPQKKQKFCVVSEFQQEKSGHKIARFNYVRKKTD